MKVGDPVWLVQPDNQYEPELAYIGSEHHGKYIIIDSNGGILGVNKNTLITTAGHFTIEPLTKEERTKLLIGALK